MAKAVRKHIARRTYVARSDSSIATVAKRIEKVFGLPEGSVELVRKSGRKFRSDSSVENVRKHYAE